MIVTFWTLLIASWALPLERRRAAEQSDEADEAPALQRSARLRAPSSSSRASQLIRVLDGREALTSAAPRLLGHRLNDIMALPFWAHNRRLSTDAASQPPNARRLSTDASYGPGFAVSPRSRSSAIVRLRTA